MLKKTIEQLREEEAEVLARKSALFKAQEDYNDLKFALQKAQEHTANIENAIKVPTPQITLKEAHDEKEEEKRAARCSNDGRDSTIIVILTYSNMICFI